MQKPPTTAWVGQWASVIGMIDPPYTSKKYGYEHVGITISNTHQINIIPEDLARLRLASAHLSMEVGGPSSNREKISALTDRRIAQSNPPIKAVPNAPLQLNPAIGRSNKDLIAGLKQKAGARAVPVCPVPGVQQPPPSVIPTIPANKSSSTGRGCNAAVFMVLLIGLLIWLLVSGIVRVTRFQFDSGRNQLIERG